MRKTLQLFLAGLLALAVVTSGLALPAWGDGQPPVQITILHTNDLHGNLEPDSKGRGGLARIATLVQQYRQASPPGQVVFVDCGDVAQGTPISNIFQGEPMYKALDLIGVDAATIGNHEFDWGPRVFRNMTSLATFPIVCANLVDASSGKTVFPPYVVKEVSGLKVAFLGLVTPSTPSITKQGDTAGYKFLDPVASLRRYLGEMQARSDLVVVLSHLGVEGDKELAAEVPEVAAIVGGHSHTALEQPLQVNGIPIVQAGKYSRYLGVLELRVDPHSHKVVSSQGKLIEINAQAAAEDPAVVALIQKYAAEVTPRMSVVVGGTTGEILKRHGEEALDSPLGNLIADALRSQTRAQVALYNWGGIREDSLPQGPLTMGQIFRLLPFDDQVVVLELSGKDLLEALSFGLTRATGPIQVSGVEVSVDGAKKQVVQVQVEGRALDPEATYTVATTEFLAGGGDDYTSLRQGKIVQRLDVARDVFIAYLKAKGQVEPPRTGRIRLLVPASLR